MRENSQGALEAVRDHLAAARVNLECATGLLNSESTQCSRCGVAHWDNPDEFRLHREIAAMAEKAASLIQRVDRLGRKETTRA